MNRIHTLEILLGEKMTEDPENCYFKIIEIEDNLDKDSKIIKELDRLICVLK